MNECLTSSAIGKSRRLARLLSEGRMIIVPVDDSLIFGPFNGLMAINNTLDRISKAEPNAILGYKGSLSILKSSTIPCILNITASTLLGNHIKKMMTGSILDAIRMNAECVAVHVNYTSDFENEMIKQLAECVNEADLYGMPVLAISYPRKSLNGKDYNYDDWKLNQKDEYTDLVSHCVRISAELGADIIKTQFTGDSESFKKVVDSALGKPVVIAGGPLVSVRESYSNAKAAIEAGAAGISFGRNVFNADSIEAYLAGIREIVFNGAEVEQAVQIYERMKDCVKLD